MPIGKSKILPAEKLPRLAQPGPSAINNLMSKGLFTHPISRRDFALS
jgi:hypothetical protein